MKTFFYKQEIGIKRGFSTLGTPQDPARFPCSLFFVSPQSPGDQVWAKKGSNVLDGEVNHNVGFKERRKKGEHPGQRTQRSQEGSVGHGGGQGPGG